VTSAEKYVAAAYLVVFMLVLAYVLIIALKLQRLDKALQDLCSEASPGESDPEPTRPAAASGQGKHHVVEPQI
jgi:CcmD family protein